VTGQGRLVRRRKWVVVEYLSRYMTIVGGAQDAQVLCVVGSAESERVNVIDLQVVRAVARAAQPGPESAALLVTEHDLIAGCGGDMTG